MDPKTLETEMKEAPDRRRAKLMAQIESTQETLYRWLKEMNSRGK